MAECLLLLEFLGIYSFEVSHPFRAFILFDRLDGRYPSLYYYTLSGKVASVAQKGQDIST